MIAHASLSVELAEFGLTTTCNNGTGTPFAFS